EVAWREGVELREVGDLLGHRPDHFRQIGALALLAVHVEPEGAFGGMPDFPRRRERAARCCFVEVLAEGPRPPVVLPPLLSVAARHVEADRVAEDMIVRLPRVDAL